MHEKLVLSVQNLSISFLRDSSYNKVIHEVSFDVRKNEILGIVGESGSGKSVSSLDILGLLPKKKTKISGELLFNNRALTTISDKEFRRIRGTEISMIFQEPMSSLNPSLSCGYQVVEILLQHTTLSKKEAITETITLFEKVKLPRPSEIFKSYPHQISGGQKQRVMIAMAIACKPQLLIADEPTTALDVTVQNEIITLLKELQQETGMSIIFISHDLSLVSEIADRVVVMYKGEVVETAFAKALFHNPQHEYTKALINARPALDVRLKKLPTITNFLEGTASKETISNTERTEAHKKLYEQTPLLKVENVAKTFYTKGGLFKPKGEVRAVQDVSFEIYEGETLGLVGESGCGKSTLGNAILQLERVTEGHIYYRGIDITAISGGALRKLRKELQIIFQDPFASLNPRLTVGQAIQEPMEVHKLYKTKVACRDRVLYLLERVGLEKEHYHRYPHEFSGGQRQRIGIARTIAVQPKLIVCDESVSALDISVQAQVLNLLNELKEDFGFTYIFISHDLAVVKYMADQLVVMNKGQIEEMGEADTIYESPKKAYTKALINAIPKGI